MALDKRYRIVHTDRTDSSTADLIQSYDMDTDEGIQASMDSFQFRILLGSKPDRTIELNDGIDIYFGEGASDPTQLIINGIVTELVYDISVTGYVLTVRGVNRVERLLFSPLVASYDSDFAYTGKRDSQARTGWGAVITHMVDRVNEYKADADTTLITYDSTSIPQIGNLTGDYRSDWKSVYEHIERLSSAEWTPNNQNYMIELDTDNKLHLRSKDTDAYKTPVTTLDLDGSDANHTSLTYGFFDVINALYLNCGVDRNGNSVIVTLWDSNSMGQYGAKFKYIKEERIAANYRSAPGYDDTVAIDTERAAIRNEGKKRAAQIISNLGSPRYKCDIDFDIGNTNYIRGKVYKIESSEIDAVGTTEPLIPLRLYNIIQRFSARSGWTTRLQLKEDEETIKQKSS